MSDFKSKLPDFKELSSMASKLYKGLKTSIEEIIEDYQEKRASSETTTKTAPKSKEAPAKAAKPAEEKKKPVDKPDN